VAPDDPWPDNESPAPTLEAEFRESPALDLDLDPVAGPVLRRLRDDLSRRLPARLACVALTGAFGRGEGLVHPAVPVKGEGIPAPSLSDDLEVLAVIGPPLSPPGVERAAREAVAAPGAAAVRLTVVLEDRLPALSSTAVLAELAEGRRVVAGEPAVLDRLPRPDPAGVARSEAEPFLRRGLLDLLIGEPASAGPRTSAFHTARAVLDAAAAILIFAGCHVPRFRDRRDRIEALGGGPSGLAGLLEGAMEARRELRAPGGWTAERFWASAVHLHIEALLGMYGVTGDGRATRIARLLSAASSRWIDPVRLAIPLFRAVLPGGPGRVSAVAMGLLAERDWDAPRCDFGALARRAGLDLPRAASWDDVRRRTIAAWPAGEARVIL